MSLATGRNPTFSCQMGWSSLTKDSPTSQHLPQGHPCVDDVWYGEHRSFLTWERAQEKFNLMLTEAGDWTMITDKISGQWRHLLDVHSNTNHLGQLIGLYIDRGEDPALVLQCVTEFSPPCMQLHRLSMPLPV